MATRLERPRHALDLGVNKPWTRHPLLPVPPGSLVNLEAHHARLPRSPGSHVAVWNDRDLSSLRQRLEAILVPDVVFIDPTIVTRNIDEFEANVRVFRAK